MKQTRFDNVYMLEYKRKQILLTKNLTPKKTVYGEDLIKKDGVEYRSWDHTRSKLAAGIMKGLSQIAIRKGSKVLYLGAASGTTLSHVSDIIEDGFAIGLDFAPRVMRDFYFLCKERKNLIPLLADANNIQSYAALVPQVDVVFQDIAQRNQLEIFLKNLAFLKKGGFGLLVIKARSVDTTKHPKDIFKDVKKDLEKKVTIVDYKELDPFEKDHAIFVIKK